MAEEGTPDSGDGASQEAAPKKPWREMNREEAMERFDAYHAKQRANRRRMTGDDVQEMLRQRRADRRRRRSERRERRHDGQAPQRDPGQVVRMSLGGALLVGAIGTGALAATSTDTTEVRSRDNDLEIASLEGEIRELEAVSWDEGDAAALEEQLDEAVDQAREKGEEVAELQNTYQEILADLDDAEPSGDGDGEGGGDEAFAPVSEHRAKLVDYFDESARIVENEDAYRPGADVPHGPGEIDVLFPWYIRYADEHRNQYAEASLNSWELVSATPRIGSQGTVTVAWLNSDASSGDLLAWARGTYDAEAGAFINLSVGQTTIGDRYAGGAGQDEEDQD